jgi:H+/Cl- antiporter ClcA
MAFIEIFFLSIFAIFIFIAILSVFIPSFIIALVNLIQGIRHNWPKKNIVLLAVFGTIAGSIILIWFITFLYNQISQSGTTSSSTSELVIINNYIMTLSYL